MGLFRTGFDATEAADASDLLPVDLDPGRDAFRIMTPQAGKRTSLEEDRTADAGTVLGGHALDPED